MAWADSVNGRYRGGYWTPKPGGGKRKAYVKDEHGRTLYWTSKRDAKKAATKAEVDSQQSAPQAYTIEAAMPWGKWYAQWRKGNKRMTNAAIVEGRHVENHIMPTFCETPLNQISRKMVRDWINELENSSPLGPRSINLVYGIFRASINAAIDDEILMASPLVGIKLPNVRARKQPHATAEWLEAFKVGAADRVVRPVEFAYETSLRPGEVCGLHVADVDRVKRIATITHTAVKLGAAVKGYEIDGPRTFVRMSPKDGDERVVPLTAKALAIYDAAIAGRELRKGCGLPHWNVELKRWETCTDDVVFLTRFGKVMTPFNFNELLRRNCKRLGLPMRSPYAQRRGYATRNARVLDVLTLSKIMGHSKIDLTALYHQLEVEDARALLDAANGERPGLTVVSNDDETTVTGGAVGADNGGAAGGANPSSSLSPDGTETPDEKTA